MYLAPDTDIFFVPYISAGISGRFTASLLTLPDGECAAADLGRTLCIAHKGTDGFECAAFSMMGAFDGTGLESGMAAENGAIDSVRRESDGTIVYEVVGDGDSTGISPCAAAMAVGIMLDMGALDGDGILIDRDLFAIGEDFFVSQTDIRAVQTDKARLAAALLLLPKCEACCLSGEMFTTSDGLKALNKLNALPKWFSNAAFCRNSTEQGIIMCLENPANLEKAFEIAKNSKDITEQLFHKFDKNYLDFLSFST